MSRTQNELTDSSKERLYGLAATVCARVIARASEQRSLWPPFGLIASETLQPPFQPVEKLSWSDPFGDLKVRMQSSLLIALDQELRYLDGLVVDQAEPASLRDDYQRFKEITGSHLSSYHPGPRGFIGAGINTGINVMSRVLQVIPIVARREGIETTGETLSMLARNSYHLVAGLSAKHIHDFARTMGHLESGGDGCHFNAAMFTIRRSASGFSLQPTSLELESPHEGALLSSFGDDQPGVGCPALRSLGGAPPVKTLWDWHLDIAATIYDSFASCDGSLPVTDRSCA